MIEAPTTEPIDTDAVGWAHESRKRVAREAIAFVAQHAASPSQELLLQTALEGRGPVDDLQC